MTIPPRLLRAAFFLVLIGLCLGMTQPGEKVQSRVSADVQAGKPIVVHVIVALADNRYQGIVPVPAALGNGQDAANNLYWGAAFGVRGFLPRRAGWEKVKSPASTRSEVLDRVVYRTTVQRQGRVAEVYLVAEAWDGRQIKMATRRFLSLAAGQEPERLEIEADNKKVTLNASGSSHLLAYVGHDGLMDFSIEDDPSEAADAKPRSAMVLACASKPYFEKHLRPGASHALLMTTGLMAPEAYTLDAAIRAWAAGAEPHAIHEASAAAYHRYQKCGKGAARKLFVVEGEIPPRADH